MASSATFLGGYLCDLERKLSTKSSSEKNTLEFMVNQIKTATKSGALCGSQWSFVRAMNLHEAEIISG